MSANTYGARCFRCRDWVDPGKGELERMNGAWAVTCLFCIPGKVLKGTVRRGTKKRPRGPKKGDRVWAGKAPPPQEGRPPKRSHKALERAKGAERNRARARIRASLSS